MEIMTRTYNIEPNGKVDVTEAVTVDSSPQSQRCENMAKKRPGEIVVGLRLVKSGEIQHESERYLLDF